MQVQSISFGFFRGNLATQRTSHSSDAEQDAYLITTFEAALEYIRKGGLLSQTFTTVYENGKSKQKRKWPLYSWSSQASDSASTCSSILLKMFELIEIEDVDSIKLLLRNWNISSQISSQNKKQNLYTNDKAMAQNQKEPDLIPEESNSVLANSEAADIKEYLFNNNPLVPTRHACHPLCLCNEEFVIAHSPQISQDFNPSISVILHSRDDLGRTALHLASLVGNPLIVELLISHNDITTSGLYKPANCINCKDVYGMTPIHYACMKGHQNVVLLLLHADADHNVIDNEKNTALHVAANYGNESCVKALLYYAEHKSCVLSINAQNVAGDTSLHLAAKWGFSNIVEILLSYDARYFFFNFGFIVKICIIDKCIYR